jgi:hypothetical protein
MTIHDDSEALAALAAHRDAQATLDARRRAERLDAARRHEEALLAGADRLTGRMGELLRRLKTTDAHAGPTALRQASRVEDTPPRRDAA